jgi:dihydrofolate reductase
VTVTADLAISLDGYVAGTDVSLDNPGGDGAEPLFEWIHNLASWRERQGMTGGEENRDSELMREWFDATGAVVMGRMMYDTGEEFWGDNPPFRAPVFVLTHRPRPTLVKEGGTTFTFVTDGIHSALARAKAAAGNRNVDIAGGASTVRQYLGEDLIDELHLHVVPVLLGDGLRLFEGPGAGRRDLEPVATVATPLATHLKYRFVKR